MLKINDDMLNRSEFLKYMLYLFQVTSEETYPQVIHIPTPEFNSYIEILYTRSNQPLPEIIVDNNIPIVNIPDDPTQVVLAFSGGKDSVAHAAYLKDNNLNPRLFYVHRANRSYPNEYNVAKTISEMLQAPLIEDTLQYSGKVTKAESPVKNHVILALIIEYMTQHNLTRCACGTYLEDTLQKTSTQFGLSDAYEFYIAFEKAVQSFFPNFKWLCWFHSEVHALSYLVNKHPELIPQYQSCLLPDRYRSNIRKHNEEKYHITLLPNRCLSCWKCAQEYLILHLLGYHHLSQEIITQKILPQFLKDLPKVMAEDQLPNDPSQLSVPQLINAYITLDDIPKYSTLQGVLDNIDTTQFK